MKTAKCEIEHCDNDVMHKKAGLCSACYSSMYYWGKYKFPTDVLVRKKKLVVYMDRMRALQPKVVHLPSRKRA